MLETRLELNCDHIVGPSLDLIISVLTPYLRAVATMPETVPPDERERSWHPVVLDEMARKDVELSEVEAACTCA